jgi:hypothetical protein
MGDSAQPASSRGRQTEVEGRVRCDWILPESEQWRRMLTTLEHDVYHLPSYAALAAATEGGQAGALVVDEPQGRLLLPLVIRTIASARVDAVSPYGYPGPIWSAAASGEFVQAALAAAVARLQSMEVVSAFVRLHPTLNADLTPLRDFGDVVAGAETVCMDLTLSLDDMWRETRENHRRSIRRAERDGFEVHCDTEWRCFDEFLVAYRETMARVDAADYYYFSDQYFSDLRAALGARLHLVTANRDGRVAAAALFTECSGIVQYHLGGTRDEFLRHAPMKLVFHFARAWFKERGATLLHLGGGVSSRDDSLFHFKAGFSSRRARFHSWRLVTARETYEELVAHWRQEAGRAPGGGFFPAYREPR